MKKMDTKIKDTGLDVDFYSEYLSKEESDIIFDHCEKLYCRSGNVRSNTIYGDKNPSAGKGLIYSTTYKEKTTYREAKPWPDWLIDVKNKVEQTTENIFNFCSLMKYPNGSVVIKRHRDKEMVSGSSICGISVGSTRRFMLSPPYYSKSESKTLELVHGSLYCLLPPTNDTWTHEILPDEGAGVRYSLTFRNIPVDNLVKTIPPVIRCEAVLKSGQRKGELCNAVVNDKVICDFTCDFTCKRHKK